MIAAVLKYGALSGKTHAMFGRLLKPKDYAEMIQKKAVCDVASYLKYSTHFSHVLGDIEESCIHRGHLENILKHDYIDDFGKLIKFTKGDLRVFINSLFIRLEVESLKLLCRVFEAGHVEQGLLEESLLFLTKYDELNIPKLALSRNLEDLVSGLKGTSYYDVLNPFLSAPKENRLFKLEMALDLHYFTLVQETFSSLLKGRDLKLAREVIGIEIDVFNIFWIYRSKTFYQTDKELIYSYIVKSWYKVNRRIVDALINAKTSEEFLSVLNDTVYAFLFKGHEAGIFEHNYLEFVYKYHRTKFRTDNFSIACVVSFLKLREIELNNIISIIEGIRYKLPSDQIEKYLVGVKP